MRNLAIGALIAAIAATPAAAMDVATFLVKVDALKSKGPFAVISGDYKPLMTEIDSSAKALRTERLAAVAAGARPAYCPEGRGGLSPNDIFGGMHAIPAAQQPQIQVKDALRAVYAKKYPCPT